MSTKKKSAKRSRPMAHNDDDLEQQQPHEASEEEAEESDESLEERLDRIEADLEDLKAKLKTYGIHF